MCVNKKTGRHLQLGCMPVTETTTTFLKEGQANRSSRTWQEKRFRRPIWMPGRSRNESTYDCKFNCATAFN